MNALTAALLQEILFRGAVLFPLRRFGDGFAVIISAVLSAVSADSPLTAVYAFAFGLAAGYFTVRSGSVLPALAARLIFELLVIGVRFSFGMLAGGWTDILILAVALAILISAVVAYFYYVKADPNAFRLANSPDAVSYTHLDVYKRQGKTVRGIKL